MRKIYLSLIGFSAVMCLVSSMKRCSVESVPSTTDSITFYAQYPILETINDSVFWEIISQDIEHPDIVYAQAILETGHFTSSLFQQNNNTFGMKLPKVRTTTALGEKSNHAYYESWQSSVEDYKLWQDSFASGKTREEYFAYLSRVYSQDAKYVSKLKNIISKQLPEIRNQLLSQL